MLSQIRNHELTNEALTLAVRQFMSTTTQNLEMHSKHVRPVGVFCHAPYHFLYATHYNVT